ncbi:hypothetical protein DENSPDRAFT_882210 [Dentipellis sp. KUC8613]|nr:hypothetical protein DENSPDRAFT_882210 [Dentipellis sp. KUC8613]
MAEPPPDDHPRRLPPFSYLDDAARSGDTSRFSSSRPLEDRGTPPDDPNLRQEIISRNFHYPVYPLMHDQQLEQSTQPHYHAARSAHTYPDPVASQPPVASSSRVHVEDHRLDPAQVPLPATHDDDLSEPAAIAHATGHAASTKVAGSRRKGKQPMTTSSQSRRKSKGKQRAEDETPAQLRGTKRAQPDHPDDLDDEDAPLPKRGRPASSRNYSFDDQEALLDLVAEELPLGQRGWARIEKAFAKWAKVKGRPVRKLTSLETKYKQLVKTKKPTGTGVCPPLVARAHSIEDLINEKAGTRDLDDLEYVEEVADQESGHDSGDDNEEMGEDEVVESQAVHPMHREATFSATVMRPAVPLDAPSSGARQRARRSLGNDLASKLSHAFDPEVQRQRDAERSTRSFQQTQLFSLTQQLRDANTLTEALRTQLAELRERLHHTERALDRAEFRLQIADFNSSTCNLLHGNGQSAAERTHNRHQLSPYHRQFSRDNPPVDYRTREKRKRRFNIEYPDGGGYSGFVSDPSETDDYAWPPQPPRARSSSPPLPPTPGPSRQAATVEQSSGPSQSAILSAPPTHRQNSVEVTVTPRHGRSVSFQVGSSKGKGRQVAGLDDDDSDAITDWSPSPK